MLALCVTTGEGDANLDQELKDLGVDVGDDHFLSAGTCCVCIYLVMCECSGLV